MTHLRERVRNGFLTMGPTLDSLPHFREEEEEPDTIEVHNYMPTNEESADQYDRAGDDEEPSSESGRNGEIVARFPASGYTALTEGDEIVVYRGSGSPTHRTDIYEMDTKARDSRPQAPRTLAELNRFHAAHYGNRRTLR